jgi:hypothetical protein
MKDKSAVVFAFNRLRHGLDRFDSVRVELRRDGEKLAVRLLDGEYHFELSDPITVPLSMLED